MYVCCYTIVTLSRHCKIAMLWSSKAKTVRNCKHPHKSNLLKVVLWFSLNAVKNGTNACMHTYWLNNKCLCSFITCKLITHCVNEYKYKRYFCLFMSKAVGCSLCLWVIIGRYPQNRKKKLFKIFYWLLLGLWRGLCICRMWENFIFGLLV